MPSARALTGRSEQGIPVGLLSVRYRAARDNIVTLREHFESTRGTGIRAMANAAGEVDGALYARPHFTDEQNLYASSQAERLPCSARSIIYCPTVVAGFVALLVKQHAVGKSLPRELLVDLPSLNLSVNSANSLLPNALRERTRFPSHQGVGSLRASYR